MVKDASSIKSPQLFNIVRAYPTNITSVNLVMGCPNARAGVGIVEEKTLRATKFRPLRLLPLLSPPRPCP